MMAVLLLVAGTYLLNRGLLLVLTRIMGVYPSYPYDRAQVIVITTIVWLVALVGGVLPSFSEESVHNPIALLIMGTGLSLFFDRLDNYLSVSTDHAKLEVIRNTSSR